MQKLATHIGNLTGWRRNGFALLCGMLATLTLAPFFLFPLLIPAFTGLYWLIEGDISRRRRFWDGWWWGWGFYITGLYWMCIALLTDAEKFAWLIPFALFGLTGVIAIYSGLACWLMSFVPTRGLSRIMVFSVLWMCVEYARGHLFSGFPWNLPGYSFGFSDQSLQLSSLVGVYGLTWFAVLLGTSFAALREKRGLTFINVVWCSLILGVCWGGWRLQQADAVPVMQRYVPGVALRLVQANIAQPHKWDPKLQMQGLQDNIKLTQSPGLDHITHVIWPETAVPYIMTANSSLTHMLGSMLPPGRVLITGTLRSDGKAQDWKIWNSLMAIDHDGHILGDYDKVHLVPFGEFQPLRNYLPKSWLTPVGDKDFSRGDGVHTLEWPGLPPVMPLICYEVIFPELVTDPVHPPQLLLSVTNDAWFGISTGPHQHFQMARMRAAEQGVPMVRVANTGISAVVDSFGRILSSMPLGTRGILDVRLPVAQSNSTLYAKHNCAFMLFLILISGCLMLSQRLRKKN